MEILRNAFKFEVDNLKTVILESMPLNKVQM